MRNEHVFECQTYKEWCDLLVWSEPARKKLWKRDRLLCDLVKEFEDKCESLEQSIISACERVGCVNASEMADRIEGLTRENDLLQSHYDGEVMENAELRARVEWRPIETAPYDEFVLFLHASGSIIMDHIYDCTIEEHVEGTCGALTGPITHWMPLLPGPDHIADASKKAEG